jgi:hypothetical protein
MLNLYRHTAVHMSNGKLEAAAARWGKKPKGE